MPEFRNSFAKFREKAGEFSPALAVFVIFPIVNNDTMVFCDRYLLTDDSHHNHSYALVLGIRIAYHAGKIHPLGIQTAQKYRMDSPADNLRHCTCIPLPACRYHMPASTVEYPVPAE